MAEIYDNALCTVNGKLLVQSTSISIEYLDKDRSLSLLGGKFAIQPSDRLMKVGILEGIPISGFVFDWLSQYLNVEYIKFGIMLQGSGLSLVSRGVLTSPGLEFQVGSSSRMRCGFVGEPKAFT